MSVKLEDVPPVKGERFTKKITVSVTPQAYESMRLIKEVVRKDPSELMRMLLDDFLTENLDKIKSAI